MKTDITQLIEAYLESKAGSWSPSTQKSERQRLVSFAPVLDGKPETLWKEMEKREIGAYTRVTIWTRVACFWAWLSARGHVSGNPYQVYREENGLKFKVSNVYLPKHVDMTVAEAKRRIETIPDQGIREWALYLLKGGLRYTESFTQGDTQVVKGKGGKLRRVYSEKPTTTFSGGYHRFLRMLKKHTGLTPHQLRKIMATQMGRKLDEADMCKMFGWSSFETASKYIAPRNEEQLAEAVRETMEEENDDDDSQGSIPA